MILALLLAADPSWLAFDRCEETIDVRLVRALVLLDAPKVVNESLAVRCDGVGRVTLATDQHERAVSLYEVSEPLRAQMLALMVIDEVRTRFSLPLEGSSSAPVEPVTIAQLLRTRDKRYATLTGGLTLSFVGTALIMMAVGVGLTIFGSQQNDVNLRTTGIGIGIASPFIFSAGVVTFALWAHDRRTAR